MRVAPNEKRLPSAVRSPMSMVAIDYDNERGVVAMALRSTVEGVEGDFVARF